MKVDELVELAEDAECHVTEGGIDDGFEWVRITRGRRGRGVVVYRNGGRFLYALRTADARHPGGNPPALRGPAIRSVIGAARLLRLV